MRVFDLAGVVEAMGEVGRVCDTKNDRLQQNVTDEEGDQFQEEEDEAEQFKIKRVVADSQDDSLDLSQPYVQQINRLGNTQGKLGNTSHENEHDSNRLYHPCRKRHNFKTKVLHHTLLVHCLC